MMTEKRRELIAALRAGNFGFEWNFVNAFLCGLEVAKRVGVSGTSAAFEAMLGLDHELSDNIFGIHGKLDVPAVPFYGVPSSMVTPEMVADALEGAA